MSRCNLPSMIYLPAIPGIPTPPSPADIISLITNLFGAFLPAYTLVCPLD